MHTEVSRYHTNTKRRLSLLGLVGVMLLVANGCTRTPATQPPTPPARQVSTAAPLKVVVLQDKSGSVDSTRTPRVTMSQFDALVSAVRERGGGIAFGFIDDESNESFTVMRVDAPRAVPTDPGREGNPFKVAEAVAKYKKELGEFEKNERQRQSAADQQVEAFKARVGSLLEDAGRSGATDVYGGLNRADLYLAEVGDTYSSDAQPQRFMILISDGLDNMRRPVGALRSRSQIILVNGSANIGVMKDYTPLRFEGIDSAFLYVTKSAASSPQQGTDPVAQK